MYIMRVMLPSRRPSKHVQQQVLRLDRKFLPGNDLTLRQLQNGYLFWVIDEGQVVAYLLIEDYKKTYTIRSIVVTPDYRQDRLATRLLKSGIRWAIKKKGKTIHTYTSGYNYPSMNLLIGLGFKILKYYETYSVMDGRDVPWVSFRKYL